MYMASLDEEAANNTGEDDEDEIEWGLLMTERYKTDIVINLVVI